MLLNLNLVGEYLSQYYIHAGRPTKNQACCSLLLDTPAWIPFHLSALISILWSDLREQYARSSLLPKWKYGKKPKKELGADGKLAEPEPDKYAARNLVESILNEPYADILKMPIFPNWILNILVITGILRHPYLKYRRLFLDVWKYHDKSMFNFICQNILY